MKKYTNKVTYMNRKSVLIKINPKKLLIMTQKYYFFSGSMTGSDKKTQHIMKPDETPENRA